MDDRNSALTRTELGLLRLVEAATKIGLVPAPPFGWVDMWTLPKAFSVSVEQYLTVLCTGNEWEALAYHMAKATLEVQPVHSFDFRCARSSASDLAFRLLAAMNQKQFDHIFEAGTENMRETLNQLGEPTFERELDV